MCVCAYAHVDAYKCRCLPKDILERVNNGRTQLIKLWYLCNRNYLNSSLLFICSNFSPPLFQIFLAHLPQWLLLNTDDYGADKYVDWHEIISMTQSNKYGSQSSRYSIIKLMFKMICMFLYIHRKNLDGWTLKH